MSDFVHLRAHSARSIEDGLIEPEDLVKLAAAARQPAVAITDLNRMFGVVPFYKSARQAGVKPIVGAEVWVEPDLTQPSQTGQPAPAPVKMLLLCQNQEGYRRLMRWMSRAYLFNHVRHKASVRQSWMKEDGTEGLIALAGDWETGEIAQALLSDRRPDGAPEAEGRDAAEKALGFYKGLFGDRFYLEIQRAGQAHETEFVSRMVSLASDTDTPLVATHPIVFGAREDYFAHEVRACIDSGELAEDPTRVSRFTREQYFKTTEEMGEMFADLPSALANAGEIAKRCSTSIELGKNYLPDFPTPNGENQNDYFEAQSRAGLERRLEEIFPDPAVRARDRAPFDARVRREVETIKQMGFAGYFLIVADFINWAKNNDIPVGPGRGSGAGSLVAYSLRITDLEPTRYDLLFERFLNPERVSMPDFDVDFDIERRGDVIDYVRQRYGSTSVSQIATYNTLAARAAIKDVSRVLGCTPYFSLMLSSLVPNEIGITLADALGGKAPKLKEKYDQNKEVRRIVDTAMKVEGLPRTIGTHAGGVVIAPGDIWDFSPLYVAEDAAGAGVVAQYDKDDVEKAGLVKFDFLGLNNLTVIHQAMRFINQRPEFQQTPFSLEGLTFDSPDVYRLLQEGDTVGVFQLEGQGITRVCTELKPDCFEDLIALLALFRPGPLNSGMVSDFIRRKHGEAEVSYPHPLLEPVLKPTYGVMVYQEQVMQAAQVLAGYSLGGADLLRRAMGKKKPEEMAKERSKFEGGCVARGIDGAQAVHIFDLMEKFAEYGFNKSHSAGYAMLSYQTAWLKAHYPAEFYAAYMNVVSDKKDKLALLIKSARARGLTILPPDINEGVAEFQPVGDRALRYGLTGLKGVGAAPIRGICEAREREGKFTSLFDFFKKVGRSVANKTVAETLARVGAFDGIHPNRASVLASVKDGLDYAAKLAKKEKQEGPLLPELAGLAPAPAASKRKKKEVVVVEPMMTEVPDWPLIQRMEQEKIGVGFYLSGHPFDGYAERFGGLKAVLPLARVNEVDPETDGDELRLVAGIVVRVKEHTTGKGTKMAFLSIDDGHCERDLTLFPSTWEEHGNWIKPGVFMACSAAIRPDRRGGEHGNELTGEDAYSGDRLQALLAQSVDVVVDRKELARLQEVIGKHLMEAGAASEGVRGGIPLTVYMPENADRYYRAELSGVRLKPSTELLADLAQAFGEACVRGRYAASVELARKPRPPRRRP